MKCGGRKSNGEPCKNGAIPGGRVCRYHGGAAPQVRKVAAVRAEVLAWGLQDAHEDPSEVLLRLVSQSARRAAFYAGLLEQAYEAAEQVRAEGPVDVPADDDGQRVLDRVLGAGGMAMLVGHTYGAVKDIGIYATGEAIRALVELEAAERDRCARFCKVAIDAGIEAKKVELASRYVDMLDSVVRAILTDLGHDLKDPRVIQSVVTRISQVQPLPA